MITTIDANNDDYSNLYKNLNFFVVPFYIEPNIKSSDVLLVVYKTLIKTICPSITLLKHNLRGFPDQKIDSDNNNIKGYNKTMQSYQSSAIIKKNKTNNAIEIRTGKKFNLTVIDIDNVYLAFDLFVLFFQTAGIIKKLKLNITFIINNVIN